MSKHIGGALADGMNSGVGSAFNRSGIFSVTECNTLIQWVEAERIAKWEKIEEHGRWKHHQFVASPTTTKPALIRVERKLCELMAELNNEIWRFHITSFGPLVLHRYESGDRVGLHVDLVTDYCDRKLAAIVQLSAPDAYRGGVLEYGLPALRARPEQGSLLVFPAWVPHELKPITSGVRYTALCFALGPSFR